MSSHARDRAPALTTDEIWEGLLSWLASLDSASESPVQHIKIVETNAGRGLVADGDVPPNTRLINIPSRALLNTVTLCPLYPLHFTRTFTATQWVSLHLALQTSRHASGPPPSPSPRDHFQPFLRSLPESFPTVPLEWSIKSRSLDELRKEFGVPVDDHSLDEEMATPAGRRRFGKLLELMPPSVRVRAEDVEKRFKSDWLRVREVWTTHCSENEEESDRLLFADYLLAWLNVNTRCVYWDIGGKTSDNLTLAPIIDMINHNEGLHTKPLQTALSLSFSSPTATSPDPQLHDSHELLFSYGPHEDAMLLTEYGFTLSSNPYNSVTVDSELAALFASLPADEARVKVGLLQDEGYWGEMTLQPLPQPASASWRVLVALRLLHLKLPPRAVGVEAFEKWFDVVAGTEEVVSVANERLVRASVRRMCEAVGEARRVGFAKCEAVEKEWKGVERLEVEKECLRMLKGIWEAEAVIAQEVLEAELGR